MVSVRKTQVGIREEMGIYVESTHARQDRKLDLTQTQWQGAAAARGLFYPHRCRGNRPRRLLKTSQSWRMRRKFRNLRAW